MVFSNNLLMGAAGQATGYEIEQSIRFDNVNGVNAGGAQMYRLALTGTPTNDKKATISAWVKRATLGFNQTIAYSGNPAGSTFESLRFNTNDTLSFQGATSVYTLTTTQVFRDVGAWYHIVAEIDTANGTSADRANLYVNGEKVTSFSTATYPALNRVTNWTASSGSIAHTWGTNGIPAVGPSSQLQAGYMAEMYVLDGEKAGATAFGEFNDSGVWIPTAYSGAFGNNGYYMTGETASALGDDFSGNGLDFTTVALATTDQMSDTPTLNFCTLNPLITPATMTLTDGNLALSGYTSITSAYGTFGLSSGKWFWQIVAQANAMAGIAATPIGSQYPGQAADSYAMDLTNGTKYNNGSSASYGSGEISAGDVIGVGFDADAGTLKFFDSDGNDIGTAYSSLTSGPYFPVFRNGNSANISINFGQTGAFTFTPSGYNALNTSNLATPTISDGSKYFDTKLWTGNDTDGRAITGYNFSPDWVWIKSRSGAYSHNITDAVRGAGNFLLSNATDAEVDGPDVFGSTLAFTSDGFTLDNGTLSNLYVNAAGVTYAGWGWEANGSGSSNEDGSINTTATSVNTTAGFSISTYTGTGSNATVGHGLGIAPSFVLIKSRNDTHDWYVRTPALSGTEFLVLNTTAAKGTSSPEVWNSTVPTSTIVNIGTSIGVNRNTYNYVMYCFAEIPGYSSIGSYTGNGSTDGPFVYTGFKPAFVLTKNINTTDQWGIRDTTRNPFNVTDKLLNPNSHTAETSSTTGYIDILSNGFKARSADSNINTQTIIYMAFAENPFGGDGVAPATAR